MTPDDMIQRYAHAVASHLPYTMRAEVSAELYALLHDEIQELAITGAPTISQVEERLLNFGPPKEVALRYHRSAPIIEAVDTRLFAKLALGLVLGLTVLALSIGLSSPEPGTQALEEGLKDAIFLVLGILLVCFGHLGLCGAPNRSFLHGGLPGYLRFVTRIWFRGLWLYPPLQQDQQAS